MASKVMRKQFEKLEERKGPHLSFEKREGERKQNPKSGYDSPEPSVAPSSVGALGMDSQAGRRGGCREEGSERQVGEKSCRQGKRRVAANCFRQKWRSLHIISTFWWNAPCLFPTCLSAVCLPLVNLFTISFWSNFNKLVGSGGLVTLWLLLSCTPALETAFICGFLQAAGSVRKEKRSCNLLCRTRSRTRRRNSGQYPTVIVLKWLLARDLAQQKQNGLSQLCATLVRHWRQQKQPLV